MDMIAKIVIYFFLSFSLIHNGFSQNAIDNFSSAKAALLDGDASKCIYYLELAQNQLNGSNAKIEALKVQAYVNESDWINAKIAFTNYTNLIQSYGYSEAHNTMKELGDQIQVGLNQMEKEFNDKKDNELKTSLKQIESKIAQETSALNNKKEVLDKRNSDKISTNAMVNNSVDMFNLLTNVSDRYSNIEGDWKTAIISNTVKSHEDFLKKYPLSIYTQTANDNIIKIKARIREADLLYQEVYAKKKIADRSYVNFKHYFQADSIASILLSEYTEKEVGFKEYNNLKKDSFGFKERFKMNQEYFIKKDLIVMYDDEVKKLERLEADASNKFNKRFSNSRIIKQSLILTLGGLSVTMGFFGSLEMGGEATFSDEVSQNMILYGGVALVSGITWLVADGHSIKKSQKMVKDQKHGLDRLKKTIGPVLDVRNDLLDGRPIIKVN